MDIIATYLTKVKQEVDKVLSTSPLMIRKYTQHLTEGQGKNIRAQLVLASALDENNSIHDDAIYVAAAIELLHLASLVHDDVMDNADLRRGIATLNSLYGRKTAVICGDYILAKALEVLNKVERKDYYIQKQATSSMSDLALGELNQHLNNHNLDLTYEEYIEIIKGKTASLFSLSTYCGAVISNSEQADCFETMGEYMGIVFQLLDDCIDFESTRKRALKPIQSDFEQGVITLPLIYAFQKFPEYKKLDLTRDQINEIVYEANGVDKTKEVANNYYLKTLSILNDLDIKTFKKDTINQIFERAMVKK